MNRKHFLSTASIGALAMVSQSCFSISTNKRKPNILFLLVDDMGWSDVGYMGSKYYETPNIDKLASEGMIFTNAYANAPNCAPSRACILSGQYTPRHGIYTVGSSTRGKSFRRKLIPIKNNTTLAREVITFAEALKPAGYISASMGKWHMGNDPEFGPIAQGFDVNIAGCHKGNPRTYFSPFNFPNLKTKTKGQYLTDALADEAIKFISKNREKPFLLYLPFYAVHTPIQGKLELVQKYKNKKASNGQHNSRYAAMIETTDKSIGRITDTIKKLGLDDNTIIIFLSDNGGLKGITSNAPLRGGKGMLYEGGIREPMFVRWPNQIKAGTKCNVPVIGTDLYPTFLQLAGVKPPKGKILDGVSLLPLLLGKTDTLKRDALFWHFPAYLQTYRANHGKDARDKYFRTRPGSVIRKGDWKLIKYYEDNALELYNLKDDISEKHNLVKKEAKIANQLHTMLKKWCKKVNAPIPTEINPKYIGV